MRVCVLFMSVLIKEMEPPLSREEIIVQYVSLAEALSRVIKDDNYSSRLVSNLGLFPDAIAPLLALCEQKTHRLWMGRAQAALYLALGGSCAASPLDGVTWKLCPEVESSAVQPHCRMRTGVWGHGSQT